LALDELDLNEAQAEAIIEKAIEFGVYTDDMPSSKKDKLSTADEIVAFSIDSWVSDGVTPDSDDEDTAEAGKQIQEVLELAGVSIDEDGEITYGDVPDADGDDDNGDDDEAPIDINDIIEGYEELTPATRLKKIKALELDPEDEDDLATMEDIADWEEAQDKPSSRVLDYLAEFIGEEVDGEPADDDGDDNGDDDSEGDEGEEEPYTEEELLEMDKDELFEVADEFEVEKPKRLTDAGKKKLVAAILEAQEEDEGEGDGEDEDGEGEEYEEPWEGYEEASVKDIKEVLNDDERKIEELEYIKEYEAAREKPRQSILDLCDKRIEELSEGDEDDSEPEPEPEKRTRRRGRRGKKGEEDPDDSDDVDNAVAKDDEKDAKRAKKGDDTYTVTFKKGKSEIAITTEGLFAAVGYVTDQLAAGVSKVTVEKD